MPIAQILSKNVTWSGPASQAPLPDILLFSLSMYPNGNVTSLEGKMIHHVLYSTILGIFDTLLSCPIHKGTTNSRYPASTRTELSHLYCT